MAKKSTLTVIFMFSLLPMFLNQYGGFRSVQEITGLINLLTPIGIVSIIAFFWYNWYNYFRNIWIFDLAYTNNYRRNEFTK